MQEPIDNSCLVLGCTRHCLSLLLKLLQVVQGFLPNQLLQQTSCQLIWYKLYVNALLRSCMAETSHPTHSTQDTHPWLHDTLHCPNTALFPQHVTSQHIGATYGNKETAGSRFKQAYRRMSDRSALEPPAQSS